MTRTSCLVLVLLALPGCREAAQQRAPARDASDVATLETDPSAGAGLEDDARMALGLPHPGASRADVLARAEACAAHLAPDRTRCRFPGAIRSSSEPDLAAWWTYGFDGDRLDVAELERSEFDADEALASAFAESSERVAAELTRRLGVAPQAERLASWSAVDEGAHGARVLLERRTWTIEGALVTWTLTGTSGHHPGVTMKVRVEAPRPAELHVETLDPGLRTGEALLRLRGGPVPRPLDVPLWLAFDPDEDADRCAIHHDALVFPLPDGRLYVGQYNAVCGGRACGVIDVATGARSEPAGGCLWGDGIHHRAESIGDGHVLLTSDAEGTGAIRIVRYDPARGGDVVLELSFGPSAGIRAVVRGGGVDFVSACALPPGCALGESGERPARTYRWTREDGLVEVERHETEP